ncbi:MAG: hypothetical protein NTY09_06270 [bacterium]|nr:hypothetical protein [bacterium]
MARALKLRLEELVFTFDLDMEEFGPEVVDVTGPHLLGKNSRSREALSNGIDNLEAQVMKAIRETEAIDDDDDE